MRTVSYKQYEVLGKSELGLVLRNSYGEIEIVGACRFIFNDAGDSIHILGFTDDGDVIAEIHRSRIKPNTETARKFGVQKILESVMNNAFAGRISLNSH